MCSVCNNRPGNCPVCSDQGNPQPCQDCNGEGYCNYYDNDGNEITKEEYYALPAKARDSDPCPTCDGSGIVEYDHAPEYDHDN